jgi:hypothetical protein
LEELLTESRIGLAYGHELKSAANREDANAAANAAWMLNQSLSRMPIYSIRGAPLDPVTSLVAARPDLKEPLVELQRAIKGAVNFARQHDRASPPPESWGPLDRLEKAIGGVARLIEPETVRVIVDLAGQVVVIDGSNHVVTNRVALRAYAKVVEANGDSVPGRELKGGRIDRKFKCCLPPAVRATYKATSGNGGGYSLKPEFCRRTKKVHDGPSSRP